MAANADDLRDFYASAQGDSVLLAVAAGSPEQITLPAGRYRVRYRSVSGAATIWAKQGGEIAAAAAPSTPYDIALFAAGGDLFTVNVRGSGSGQALSFLADAGSVQIVITRISR